MNESGSIKWQLAAVYSNYAFWIVFGVGFVALAGVVPPPARLAARRAPKLAPHSRTERAAMPNQRAQIVMTEAQIQQFLVESRVATLATNGPSGYPHQVAMWYGIVDSRVCFETKAKSQKAVNLRRDPKLSISVEGGDSYDQLRGVA